jgi:hypothetical protein
VIFGTIAIVAFLIGLAVCIVSDSGTFSRIFYTALFLMLSVMFYFLITDGIIPTIQNRAVMIVDENGITDVVSWGLIKWSNIQTIEPVKVRSQGKGNFYSFTEMHIVLKDVKQYDYYNESWWIRFKVGFLNIYKGVDIVMDIDALKGKANDVFNEVNESYLFFEGNRHPNSGVKN